MILRIERRVRSELFAHDASLDAFARLARSESVYVAFVTLVRTLLTRIERDASGSHGLNLVIRDAVSEALADAMRSPPFRSVESVRGATVDGVVDRLAFVLVWEARRIEIDAAYRQAMRPGALAHAYGYQFPTPEARG